MSIKDGDLFKIHGGDCPECKTEKSVKKIISSGSFVINGYNEKNGYAKK
jgi:hypothetical protein